jgi:hypothetical protein
MSLTHCRRSLIKVRTLHSPWLPWLPWVEFCYNSAFQSSLRTLSFWVIYGRDLPQLHAYTVGEAKLLAVDAQLREWDEFLMEVRERLEQAKQYYKHHYDHKHRASEFVPVTGFGYGYSIGPWHHWTLGAEASWGRSTSGQSKS